MICDRPRGKLHLPFASHPSFTDASLLTGIVPDVQGALEHFYVEQLGLLQEQLREEQNTRAFRERVQAQASAKLQLEARQQQAAVLRSLRERLDHMALVNGDAMR